jgi:hypothetical protein
MNIPVSVYKICRNGGLIVGSAAKKIMNKESGEPNDWDILVPFDKWKVVADTFSGLRGRLNAFGGWKFKGLQGESIDVWPGSIEEYLRECNTKYGGEVVAIDIIANKAFCSSVVDISQLTFKEEG